MNLMDSNKLNEAREYEKKAMKIMPEAKRPSFHVSSPVGWFNDPNGFSLYKGEYHLFFQYHPYSIQWGPMHWGHMKTTDFIKWENLPTALAPDQIYDANGCFSGTALEFEGKHILMYTGVSKVHQQDNSDTIRQTQCIAIGDGLNYEKLDCNPVLAADMIPDGSSLEDFRDPKIWKDGEEYFALVANRSEDGSGQLMLYKSADLREWEKCSILLKCNNEFGRMWECPDFFKMCEKDILILSPQDMKAKDLEFHNGNGNLYFIGHYDKNNYTFQKEAHGVLDYGLDFYAPQTLLSKDGRRIMIAWMQTWDNYLTPGHFEWSGMMTIPRELELKNGRIYQYPVRELENYRANKVQYDAIELLGEAELPGIKGREIDMEVEILPGNYQHFQIRFAENEEYYSSIGYDPKKKIINFDRKYSGFIRDIICERQMQVHSENNTIKLRIILDKYSVELFVNDGEDVMSALYYTTLDADQIRFVVDGKAKVNIIKYDIVVG